MKVLRQLWACGGLVVLVGMNASCTRSGDSHPPRDSVGSSQATQPAGATAASSQAMPPTTQRSLAEFKEDWARRYAALPDDSRTKSATSNRVHLVEGMLAEAEYRGISDELYNEFVNSESAAGLADSLHAYALIALVMDLADSGDYERLVNLLAADCPGWIGIYCPIESLIAMMPDRAGLERRSGGRVAPAPALPLMILFDAYDRATVPENKRELYTAITRGVCWLKLIAPSEDALIASIREWYVRNGAEYEFNHGYFNPGRGFIDSGGTTDCDGWVPMLKRKATPPGPPGPESRPGP